MSQVSCDKFPLRAPVVHCLLQSRERAAERAVVRSEVGHHGRQAGTDRAGPHAREEEREAQGRVSDPIPLALRLTLDQAAQPQPTQVVGHVARRQRLWGESEQWRHVPAEVARGSRCSPDATRPLEAR